MILSHSFILLFLRLFFSLHILDHITPEVFTKVWIITCIDNNLHFHLQFTIYILQCETVEFALLVSLCVCVCVCVCVRACVCACMCVCMCVCAGDNFLLQTWNVWIYRFWLVARTGKVYHTLLGFLLYITFGESLVCGCFSVSLCL